MLEFVNVTKKFGLVKALENVSFFIEKGEFVFLTGPSGAGKTTILKMIIREIVPTSGKVLFNNVSLDDLKKKGIPYLRQEVGVVFQDYKLLEERTVKENIGVALAIKNVSPQERDDRTRGVLTMVGLADKESLFPSQLSGGELQRAALARALVVNPKLIFADEPTGNLDRETADIIIELLAKVNKEGKTVIVATHDLEMVRKYKKRVLKLEKGKLVQDSDPKLAGKKEK